MHLGTWEDKESYWGSRGREVVVPDGLAGEAYELRFMEIVRTVSAVEQRRSVLVEADIRVADRYRIIFRRSEPNDHRGPWFPNDTLRDVTEIGGTLAGAIARLAPYEGGMLFGRDPYAFQARSAVSILHLLERELVLTLPEEESRSGVIGRCFERISTHLSAGAIETARRVDFQADSALRSSGLFEVLRARSDTMRSFTVYFAGPALQRRIGHESVNLFIPQNFDQAVAAAELPGAIEPKIRFGGTVAGIRRMTDGTIVASIVSDKLGPLQGRTVRAPLGISQIQTAISAFETRTKVYAVADLIMARRTITAVVVHEFGIA